MSHILYGHDSKASNVYPESQLLNLPEIIEIPLTPIAFTTQDIFNTLHSLQNTPSEEEIKFHATQELVEEARTRALKPEQEAALENQLPPFHEDINPHENI
jgi:hypothetical protein